MSDSSLWPLAEQAVKESVGSTLNILSYMEHLIDLQSALILELSQCVDQSKITVQTQNKLAILGQFNAASSIDLDNLQSPLEAYKIPRALEIKQAIRTIQKVYLQREIGQ